jgi:ectoine hydroxylase
MANPIWKCSDADVLKFAADGFLIVDALFDPEEVDLLGRIARADHQLASGATDRLDATGAVTRLSLRNELSDDIYSAVACSPRVVHNMARLLGDEVYHYHHKMMLKEPLVGGAWEWHQDYGYWYNYGCLYPDMASCYIAIDPAVRENGCLQILRASHKLGRIDHGKVGGQTGADMERVEAALERLEHQYVELSPGSALFFHGNLLHRSDQNRSNHSRWALICCYNTRHNSPYKPSRHPLYSPLPNSKDEAVKEVGRRMCAASDSIAAPMPSPMRSRPDA